MQLCEQLDSAVAAPHPPFSSLLMVAAKGGTCRQAYLPTRPEALPFSCVCPFCLGQLAPHRFCHYRYHPCPMNRTSPMMGP